MNDLPLGMTKTPTGWPMMAEAFFDFALMTIREEAVQLAFKDDTGHDLTQFVRGTPLDRLIDQSSGREREVLAGFMDWIAETQWGIEGQDAAEEEGVLVDTLRTLSEDISN